MIEKLKTNVTFLQTKINNKLPFDDTQYDDLNKFNISYWDKKLKVL